MDAEARLTATPLPIFTLAICAVAALVFSSPDLRGLLIFDRAAIASGEFWRLVTGNLVHHSTAHLAYNLIAFFIAGTIIQIRGYPHFQTLFYSSAAVTGIIILVAEPEMKYFGGLSGIVSAAVAFLCLHGMTEKGAWRWLCAAMMAGLAAKTGVELMLGKSFLLTIGSEEFSPAPLSHLAGIVTALLMFALLRISSSKQSKRQ